MKRLVVYTAVFGGRDPIRLPPADADFDFFAFTDKPHEDWRVIQVAHPVPGDVVRSARMVKILPIKYLPDYRYSLWIDGSIALKTGKLDGLVDEYLAGAEPLAAFRHPTRTCAYQEASVCLSARLDDMRLIMDQAKAYRESGFPEDMGLPEATVLLRDHERVEGFSANWWGEVSLWSRRDQISFPFAAWRTGLQWRRFDGLVQDNGWFQLMPHL